MEFKYNVTVNDGTEESVTVMLGRGKTLVAVKDHPSFAAIVQKLRSNSFETIDDLRGAFDIGVGISDRFRSLSERVSIKNGNLYFDADPVQDAIAKKVVALFTSGGDFMPMVNFMEKVATNPNEHSRQMMFSWLEKKHFNITPDGDIIGYKGVHAVEGHEGRFCSSNSGHAIVNGDDRHGKIETEPGTIVEMPRSEVNHNPKEGCSTGLHVGDWNYARGFATVTLAVKVNPRDVVSVPTDCNEAKMRVCRYKVLDKVNKPWNPEDIVIKGADDGRITVEGPAVTSTPTRAKSVAKKKAPAKKAAAKEAAKQPAKKAAAKQAPAKKLATKKVAAKMKRLKTDVALKGVPVTPKFYEDFKKADFEKLTIEKLAWLLGEWDVAVAAKRPTKTLLVIMADKAAKARRARLAREANAKKAAAELKK